MKKTDILKEKLTYYGKPIIDRPTLLQIIQKRAPGYTIAEASKRGIISPLKKGAYYFIHASASPRGLPLISVPYEIGNYYCEGIPYAFGGLSIYHKYGFTTQLPERYTVYNTHYLGEKKIGRYRYIFKKVRESFFWGILYSDALKAYVLSPERALIQLVKEGGSKEFLKKRPVGVDTQVLAELVSKHASKTVLSKVNQLIDSWQHP